MRNIVILCLCIVVVAADDRCAWGESYWCSSLPTAKTCGAFQHCITTVWPNQKLETDGSDICTYCTNIIQDVKSYISNKQTQAQIKQFLDAACSVIPVKQMSAQCQQTVDQYLPEILDLITTEVDPQVVCSLLGLCNGLKDKVYHPKPQYKVPPMKIPVESAGTVCADCKKFLQDIKDMATSPEVEKQVEQLLEDNLCTALGTLSEECKALVEAYVPEVMELISSYEDPAVLCQALGFCNQTIPGVQTLLIKARLHKCPLYKAASKVADTAECEFCKTIAAELQTLDKDKATQEEIEKFIKDEICTNLGSLKGACDESVDTYGPEFFALLALELEPTTLCSELGLCTADRLTNSIQSLPAMVKSPQKSVGASSQCVLCEFVVKELDGMLGDNATEAEIVAALDKVCSILPSTIRQECLDFVNTYGPGILTLLEQELDPQVICTTLGLCSAGKQRKVSLPIGSPEECGVCETLMQYVDSLLTEKATIEDIEKLLEKICNFLPDTMKSECDTIIETYGPMIIQLATQYLDPREFCTEIGLCSNTTKTAPMETIVPSKAVLVGTNECTYGPAFWCASVENARKCKAEAHCKKHVWGL